MSNERDVLAREVFIADSSNSPDPAAEWEIADGSFADYAYDIADGLLTAGYRKPRTITTAEELDALPTGTIVQDAYAVACQRTSKYLNHEWERMGHVHPHRPYLPADVLWEPQA